VAGGNSFRGRGERSEPRLYACATRHPGGEFTQRRKAAKRKKKKTVGGKEKSGKEDGIQKKKTSREANPKTEAMILNCSPLVSFSFKFFSTIFSYSFAALRLCAFA
jgi:hypothetical protein